MITIEYAKQAIHFFLTCLMTSLQPVPKLQLWNSDFAELLKKFGSSLKKNRILASSQPPLLD